MNGDAKRLERLASAQGEIAGLLETRLVQEDIKAHALRTQIEQLSITMARAESGLLIFQANGLRRLADAKAALMSCEVEADAIRRKLLAARGREKVLAGKAKLFRLQEEQKLQEEEGLEAALHMTRKACGKTGMLR